MILKSYPWDLLIGQLAKGGICHNGDPPYPSVTLVLTCIMHRPCWRQGLLEGGIPGC